MKEQSFCNKNEYEDLKKELDDHPSLITNNNNVTNNSVNDISKIEFEMFKDGPVWAKRLIPNRNNLYLIQTFKKIYKKIKNENKTETNNSESKQEKYTKISSNYEMLKNGGTVQFKIGSCEEYLNNSEKSERSHKNLITDDLWVNCIKETRKINFTNQIDNDNSEKKRKSKYKNHINIRDITASLNISNNNNQSSAFNQLNFKKNESSNTLFHLNNSNISRNIDDFDDDNFDEDLNNLNELIDDETNKKTNFFKNEYHDIMPFLMSSDIELHRLTISDFDIKSVYKDLYEKVKSDEYFDSFDLYLLGLIEFYRGKYISAYDCFYNSKLILKKSGTKTDNCFYLNLSKWLAFSAIIIFFAFLNSGVGKIHKEYNGVFKISIKESIILFTILNIKSSNDESNKDDGFLGLFCCGSRKTESDNHKLIKSPISNSKSKNLKDSDSKIIRLAKFLNKKHYNDLILNPNINTSYLDEYSNDNDEELHNIFGYLIKCENYTSIEGQSLKQISNIISSNLMEISVMNIDYNENLKEMRNNPNLQLELNKDDRNKIKNEALFTINNKHQENVKNKHNNLNENMNCFSTFCEIWYLNCIISIFNNLNPEINTLNNKESFFDKSLIILHDPNKCVFKLRDLDNYLAYLSHCFISDIKFNIAGNTQYLIDEEYNKKIDVILKNPLDSLKKNYATINTYNTMNTQEINDEKKVEKMNNSMHTQKSLISSISKEETKSDYFDETIILKSIISKYPKRIYAFLRFFSILFDTSHKEYNHNKLYSIAKNYFKNTTNNNYIYSMLCFVKVSIKINPIQTLNTLQTEFSSHMQYPSIYFYFSKLLSKPHCHALGISNNSEQTFLSLMPLLFEDLKQKSFYYLGQNSYLKGDYFKTFSYWKKIKFYTCFKLSKRKAMLIKGFLDKYSSVLSYYFDITLKIKMIKEVEFNKIVICEDSLLQMGYLEEEKYNELKSKMSNICEKENNGINTICNYDSYKELKFLITESSLKRGQKLNGMIKKVELFEGLFNNLYEKEEFFNLAKSEILMYVDHNFDECFTLLSKIILNNLSNIKSQIMLYKLIKYIAFINMNKLERNEIKMLNTLSYFTYKISHLKSVENKNVDVSYDDWIRVHINLSESLCLSGKHNKGLQILMSLLEIFGVYYVDEEIIYLSEIYKCKKKLIKRNAMDFEFLISMYSKNLVNDNIENNILNNQKEALDLRKKSMSIFNTHKNNVLKNDKISINVKEENNESFENLFENKKKMKRSLSIVHNNILTHSNLNKKLDIFSFQYNVSNIVKKDYNSNDNYLVEDNCNYNTKFRNSINNLIIDPNYTNVKRKSMKSIESAELKFDKNSEKIKITSNNSNNRNILIQDNYVHKSEDTFNGNKPTTQKFDSISKMQDFVNYLNTKVNFENHKDHHSLFLNIVSDPKILYNIGKICSKYMIKLELGMHCLYEYIILLKSSENYDLCEYAFTKKNKAIFWIGIIYIHLNQYSIAFNEFDKLMKYRDLYYNKKDYKMKHMFQIMDKFNSFYQTKSKQEKSYTGKALELIKLNKFQLQDLTKL